jgi:hypothetical protein
LHIYTSLADEPLVFALGIIVGLIAFKDDWHTQATKADKFLGGWS